MGEWWYLVYSTYLGNWATHYRMARSLKGPWLAPPDDLFDANAFYAAKTAGDAIKRYICGWLAYRENEKDDGKWMWGGNLLVHEIVQRPDGTLGVRMPEAIGKLFTNEAKLAPKPILGNWQTGPASCATDSRGRYSAIHLGPMPNPCLIEATVTFREGTSGCGLMLRTDDVLEHGYQLDLSPARQRMTMDTWPRPLGGQPFTQERPLVMAPGEPVRLRLVAEDNVLVVYANDQVALSSRMYEHMEGDLALYVSEGEAQWTGLSIKTRNT